MIGIKAGRKTDLPALAITCHQILKRFLSDVFESDRLRPQMAACCPPWRMCPKPRLICTRGMRAGISGRRQLREGLVAVTAVTIPGIAQGFSAFIGVAILIGIRMA